MGEEKKDQRDLEAERDKLITEVKSELSQQIRDAIALAQSVHPQEPKAQISTSGSGSSDAHSQ